MISGWGFRGTSFVTAGDIRMTGLSRPHLSCLRLSRRAVFAGLAAILLCPAAALAQDPAFFEAAVVQLLVKMGYGGADGRATVTAKSNDGGIDGIIDQDTLGLSRVYVQAKRYALDATIDRPAIQSFVGALDGRAGSGVFITTASFTKGARDYAESRSTRVILIDGPRLARLMIQYGVGVQEKQTVRIVEVDEDFFE